MLELRLTVDEKRIAAMRDSIALECLRRNAGAQHAETVAFVAERLVAEEEPRARRAQRDRRGDVLVIVTVQSDATMLMVREMDPGSPELGASRESLLNAYTSRWSTISGRDGRTIWAEMSRLTLAPQDRMGFDRNPV